MRKVVSSLIVAITLTVGSLAGCGGNDASCDKVVDNTLKLMPKEMADAVGDRGNLVKQCKDKMTKDERKCAASAKSMEDLMKCKHS